MSRAARLLLVPAALLLTAGCHKTVGNVLASTTNDLVLPEIMALGDVGMGCASGEALGGMIAAYGDHSPKARRTSVMTLLSAAMCVDGDVWEAELAEKRAWHHGTDEDIRDARALKQRHHLVAARRYAEAFATLEAAYGVPEPGGDCPKLKRQEDQLTYLLGLSSGVLAVVHDMGASGRAGVPQSIPAAVVRGAACLDDDAWWGAPKAMQAAVFALMPEAPGAGDPWATFQASAAKGEAAGVRLANAFLVQTAVSVGRPEVAKAAITAHADALRSVDAAAPWRMLDVYATRIVQHESDKFWTEEAGYRTPFGELGTFPGTREILSGPPPGDDLLDGLELP